MSPNEAADLLGVAPTASVEEVHRAYEAKLAEAGDDVQRRDAVTAARDALLAASAWQAPAAAQAPAFPVAAPPPHPGYAPPPAAAVPQPPYPGSGPTVPPQPPYPAGPWYAAPPPPRRGLSTGAIVGITLGSIAAALVILVVVFVGIFAVAHESSRLAGSDVGSSAVPSTAPSAGGDSASTDDYDVNGVHVHNVDGWTFELTADRICAGAQITAGFSDSADGDELDRWSTVVDLQAGVPVTLTIPDSASTYDYAWIDTVDCTQA
ncbi:hypothetical protein [Leifsonia sp. NPDC077715]|uniref:hypothetical protein n=1 Tax=Leifsonia sp. NPDC077715 TaxID=3155539 RepID=UPI00343660DA